MQDDPTIWNTLINAIQLELGIVPMADNVNVTQALMALSPDERRTLTRKYRKLRRKLERHLSVKQRHRSRQAIRFMIMNICKRCAIKHFDVIAAMAKQSLVKGDTTSYIKKNDITTVFSDYDDACRRLKGETK
jgi:hypothetical protein